jgi:hypothetical protein
VGKLVINQIQINSIFHIKDLYMIIFSQKMEKNGAFLHPRWYRKKGG